ncbi:10335_t:CDS:10, partial [Scutellospora calospora]
MTALDEHGGFWTLTPGTTTTKQPQWNLLLPSSPTAPHPSARSYHSATIDGTSQIFIHAGCAADGRLRDLWSFNVNDRTWRQLPNAPGPARGGTSLCFAEGKVWRFGGFDGKREIGGLIDFFDVERGEWGDSVEFVADGVEGPRARSVAGFVPVVLGSGKLVLIAVFGEADPSSLGHEGAGKMLGDVWAFEVEGRRWMRVDGTTSTSQRPAPRGWFGAAAVGQGRLAVVGGLGEDNERLGDAWTPDTRGRVRVRAARSFGPVAVGARGLQIISSGGAGGCQRENLSAGSTVAYETSPVGHAALWDRVEQGEAGHCDDAEEVGGEHLEGSRERSNSQSARWVHVGQRLQIQIAQAHSLVVSKTAFACMEQFELLGAALCCVSAHGRWQLECLEAWACSLGMFCWSPGGAFETLVAASGIICVEEAVRTSNASIVESIMMWRSHSIDALESHRRAVVPSLAPTAGVQTSWVTSHLGTSGKVYRQPKPLPKPSLPALGIPKNSNQSPTFKVVGTMGPLTCQMTFAGAPSACPTAVAPACVERIVMGVEVAVAASKLDQPCFDSDSVEGKDLASVQEKVWRRAWDRVRHERGCRASVAARCTHESIRGLHLWGVVSRGKLRDLL